MKSCVWTKHGELCMDETWRVVYGRNMKSCVWTKHGELRMDETWRVVYGRNILSFVEVTLH
jgi:hypothetical protein